VRCNREGTAGLIHALSSHGYEVGQAGNLEQAASEAAAHEFPVVLIDLGEHVAGPPDGGGGDGGDHTGEPQAKGENAGLQIMREIRRVSPASQVVALVADGVDLDTCCRAVTYGAASFVEWRAGDGVEGIVERLVQAYERYEEALREGQDLHSRTIFDEAGVAGKSEIMARLLFQAKRAALISDAPVLIYGESGTGKQLLAEAVHRMDPKRRGKPFLSVNCAAITGSLAESVLFGHRRGAFTGATEDRPGYFRAADGGTLLLDEIGELDKSLQPKLLRTLQEGRVMPVGDHREQAVDVRVIAACNQPLPVLVEKGEFRLDLYHRLNVISLQVPPLRERPKDIPLLVQFFLRRYVSYYPHAIESVDERVYEVLARTIGTGNVRELENAVRRMLAFKKAGTRLELSDIPPGLLTQQLSARQAGEVSESLTSAVVAMIRSGRMTLNEMLEEFESVVLQEILSRSNVTHAEAARRLGLSRRTFYNKLRKHESKLRPTSVP
jgi:DNA-binding NtrC family response regulator